MWDLAERPVLELIASGLNDLAKWLYRGVKAIVFAGMPQTMLDSPDPEKTVHLFLCPEHKRSELFQETGNLSALNHRRTRREMWPGEEAFVTLLGPGDVPVETEDVSLRLVSFWPRTRGFGEAFRVQF